MIRLPARHMRTGAVRGTGLESFGTSLGHEAEPHAIMSTTEDEALAAVKSSFSGLSIPWKCIEHEPVLTVDAGLAAVGSSGAAFAKNLFVKDKKAGLFLLTTTASRAVDMKKLPALLGLTGANFRFADGAVLQEKLGVKQGAVTPLAVMNDKACEVTLVLDQALMKSAKVLLACARTRAWRARPQRASRRRVLRRRVLACAASAARSSLSTP
jgi:hypothetical protein